MFRRVQLNIADVKQELSSDEKVLESAFKLETLYRKNKFAIWGVIGALIVFFAGKAVMQTIEESRLESANKAYLALKANPSDAAALATLKEKNPSLFDLYSFIQAAQQHDINTLEALKSSANPVLADASGYTAAALSHKTADSKLYAELTLLEEAYLAIKSGDVKKADEKLSLIDQRSSVAMVAQLLKHSTIKVAQ